MKTAEQIVHRLFGMRLKGAVDKQKQRVVRLEAQLHQRQGKKEQDGS
jgi:hypothetical protein